MQTAWIGQSGSKPRRPEVKATINSSCHWLCGTTLILLGCLECMLDIKRFNTWYNVWDTHSTWGHLHETSLNVVTQLKWRHEKENCKHKKGWAEVWKRLVVQQTGRVAAHIGGSHPPSSCTCKAVPTNSPAQWTQYYSPVYSSTVNMGGRVYAYHWWLKICISATPTILTVQQSTVKDPIQWVY